MVSEKAARKYSKMLSAMAINILAIKNCGMRAIQVMDILSVEPRDNSPALIVDGFHISPLRLTPTLTCCWKS